MAAIAAGSVFLSFAAVPLATGDDLKHKKHKVQEHLSTVHSDLDESSAQVRAAAAALQAAQVQLNVAQSHLAKTRGELAAAEALDRQMQAKLVEATLRLEQAQADLADGRAKYAEQEKTLGQIVVQNYQTGDPSLMGLSMVLTSQDPTDLTGQLNSVQNVLDKESVTLDRLEASKILLRVQEDEVHRAKLEVAKQRKAAAANLAKKKTLEVQAEDAAAKVATLVGLRQQAHQEAQKAQAADMAQLRHLQKERDRISSLLRQRAEEARRRAAAAAAAANQAGDQGRIHSNGFLDYPVNGNVTSPFGWRIHPIYGYRALHDGVDFGAGCGTPIHAAASGTVLERYFQTAWGNRVIIDHGFHRGVGLATITNHMSGPAIVRPGQHVDRGQIVGYVGTTGWSTGCHLHFTVMANGVPVDPMNWF